MKKEYPSTETILRLLAGGAVLSAFILYPQIGISLVSVIGGTIKLAKEWESFPRYELRKTVDRLRKRKLVKYTDFKKETLIELTDLGKKEILHFDILNIKINKPIKWDKKWWEVIFDVPNKKKRARDGFQRKLKSLGFYFIQESVALYPYYCQKEIEFLREMYGLTKEVNLLRIDYFEDEYLARKKFNL